MRCVLFFLLCWIGLATPALAQDPHSYARPDQVKVRHLDLDLAVDFAQRRLSGTATWELERQAGADQLVLDVRHMEILDVRAAGQALPFQVGPSDPVLGSPLTITLPESVQSVAVTYRTTPEAAALQWLEPAQTAGGEHPFLFTQSQAVLARTWIPCQDTPAVRFTYRARLQVPKALMALMSASNPTQLSPQGRYEFDMPQAIPSYLMALAVGRVEFLSLGKSCGLYAEPVQLEAAAHEFAETEKMIVAVEKLFGPYRWGRYDLLVLPPSFPFGGMENPRLTFLTPTVIAGDRSLTSLIAHELAHSWSGNLVTNATWNDFWLNEGFTVYLERRIMEEVYGRDYAAMLIALGFDDLRRTLERTESKDTHLKLDLRGRDPDEGLTDIAYEKGFFFLIHLERQVGRERFDRFLRAHFDDHAFRSLDTETFLQRVREQLGTDLGVEDWVYSAGLPADFTVEPSQRFVRVDEALSAWLAGTPAARLETSSWSTMEWLRFLRGLPADLQLERVEELDRAFGFTNSGNSEILAQWFMTTIAADYQPATEALERFLLKVGRRKFLEPLYQQLSQREAGKAWARGVYSRARDNYHSVSVRTVDAILGWPYDPPKL